MPSPAFRPAPRSAPGARLARALCALLAAACAAPAFAGAADAPTREQLASEGRDLSPEEWQALVGGRTVWYRISGEVWGRESYRAEPGRVTFQFPDGECLEASWSYVEPWFCFDFGEALGGGPPHCFRHIRHAETLWALSRSGEPQSIDRIDSTPLTCGVDPTS
ncbi:hypothetical protein [uncultured Albimonas sp.]|uniref:hypothetical protein n=1 Tax=uncultured Albimonas sp. TaxID=1331701 RepID=UPI0030ECDBC4